MSATKLHCPVTASTTFLGEPWSMLLLREFMVFGGVRRFDQLYQGLGISKNVLTKRLRQFQDNGLVSKVPVSNQSKRMQYRLKRKAWELVPVMIGLHQWAERWADNPGISQLEYREAATDQPLQEIHVFSASGKLLQPSDIRACPTTDTAAAYLDRYKSRT